MKEEGADCKTRRFCTILVEEVVYLVGEGGQQGACKVGWVERLGFRQS